MGLLGRLTRFVIRHPVAVIVAWGVAGSAMYAVALVGVGDAGNLNERTATGAPQVVGADSYVVRTTSEDSTPANAGEPVAGDVRTTALADPTLASLVADLVADLVAMPDVASVATPFGAAPGPAYARTAAPSGALAATDLLRTDGAGFLVVTTLGPDAPLADHDAIAARYDAFVDDLRDIDPGASVIAFSTPLLYDHFTSTMDRDLVVGEAIALPLALIVMVFVFGGFLAASTPMFGAFASIAGGFAVVYALTFPLQVDDSAQNVVTVLGIGLCIDYGLLIVSRYREEMVKARAAGSADVREAALIRAMETAGRTVFFSAVTIGIAVGGMLVFRPQMLRAFGGAALGVVATALGAALTLVPAVAYLYGERLIRPGVLSRVPGVRWAFRYTADVTRDEGAFSRLAGWVQRRPWIVLGVTSAILLTFAAPVLSLKMRNSDVELLPPGDEFAQYITDVGDAYPAVANPGITLMTDASVDEFESWSSTLLDVPGVERVASPEVRDGHVFSGVYLETSDAGGAEAAAAVRDIRGLDPPFRLYVGGKAANQIDFVHAIETGAPLALAIVAIATIILLFLMTGSLLVPLKTLIVNALSLTASLGVLVWVFERGHLEGVLNFQSPGGIETYVVVLVLAFGFGLAMDYEVFLLSRIKELVDKGVPNNDAVRLGLQRSARIITSAAAIVVLVFLGFAAGHILVIKEVGLGLAFAVFMDATLVRMLLVPAAMTLLGDWNWWAPKPLRRLYARARVDH